MTTGLFYLTDILMVCVLSYAFIAFLLRDSTNRIWLQHRHYFFYTILLIPAIILAIATGLLVKGGGGSEKIVSASILPFLDQLLLVDGISVLLALFASIAIWTSIFIGKVKTDTIVVISLLLSSLFLQVFSSDIILYLLSSQTSVFFLVCLKREYCLPSDRGFVDFIGWEVLLFFGMCLLAYMFDTTSFSSIGFLTVAGGAESLGKYLDFAVVIIVFAVIGKVAFLTISRSDLLQNNMEGNNFFIPIFVTNLVGSVILLVRLSPLFSKVAPGILSLIMGLLIFVMLLQVLGSIFSLHIWKIINLFFASQSLFIVTGLVVGATGAAIVHLLALSLSIPTIFVLARWMVKYHEGVVDISKFGGMLFKNPRMIIMYTLALFLLVGLPISPIIFSQSGIAIKMLANNQLGYIHFMTLMYMAILAYGLTRFLSLVIYTRDYRVQQGDAYFAEKRLSWSKEEILAAVFILLMLISTPVVLPAAGREGESGAFFYYLALTSSPATLGNAVFDGRVLWSLMFILIIASGVGLFLYGYLSPAKLMWRVRCKSINAWTSLHTFLNGILFNSASWTGGLIVKVARMIIFFEEGIIIYGKKILASLAAEVANTLVDLGQQRERLELGVQFLLIISLILLVSIGVGMPG